MDLKQLRYFVAIADEGSISGAARRLFLSQPPLSAQIKLLEKELGCVLFERGSRKIQLTEAGKLLYERAQSLLGLADGTCRELRDLQSSGSGTLRLGVVSSVGWAVLDRGIRPFRAQYPNVAFELHEANTYQLLEQLHAGLLDLAVVRTPFSPGNFDCTYLEREPMLAAGIPELLPDGGGEITLRELASLPLVMYNRWEKIILDAFSQEGLTPRIVCRNEDARTTALWADSGLGVGMMPASTEAFLKSPRTLRRRIASDRLASSVCIAQNPNAYHPAAATELIAFLSNSRPAGA